jgi:tRNA-(ms[2]io[6]A)-hydroxylase
MRRRDMEALIKDLPLRFQTDPVWVERVLADFPRFVADHAANERKAAATAMDFVVRYPGRLSLVTTAARIAQEEISHFRAVFDRMKRAGYTLQPDEKNPYVGKLLSEVRAGSDDRLLDRLLVYALLEFRGIERFALLGRWHPDEDWRGFYAELAVSERGHGAAFLHEAEKIFAYDKIQQRFSELLEKEGEACRQTPLTWRFH